MLLSVTSWKALAHFLIGYRFSNTSASCPETTSYLAHTAHD